MKCAVCGDHEVLADKNPLSEGQMVMCHECARVARYFAGMNFLNGGPDFQRQQVEGLLAHGVDRNTIVRMFWDSQRGEVEAVIEKLEASL